jgi:hypothetical protein
LWQNYIIPTVLTITDVKFLDREDLIGPERSATSFLYEISKSHDDAQPDMNGEMFKCSTSTLDDVQAPIDGQINAGANSYTDDRTKGQIALKSMNFI